MHSRYGNLLIGIFSIRFSEIHHAAISSAMTGRKPPYIETSIIFSNFFITPRAVNRAIAGTVACSWSLGARLIPCGTALTSQNAVWGV